MKLKLNYICYNCVYPGRTTSNGEVFLDASELFHSRCNCHKQHRCCQSKGKRDGCRAFLQARKSFEIQVRTLNVIFCIIFGKLMVRGYMKLYIILYYAIYMQVQNLFPRPGTNLIFTLAYDI